MAQNFTSARTSTNAHKLPAVFGKITPRRNSLLFDYGCGKYTDHIRAALPGVLYLPYDPYNQPDDVNRLSINYVLNAMHARFPVTVVCSNVLNVIDDDATVQKIARHITEIVSTTGGAGYITVYEGDRSGTGRQTGPDQYQRNDPLRAYLRFFPGATVRNNMIIIGKDVS